MNTNIIEELSIATQFQSNENNSSNPYNYQPLEAGTAAPDFLLSRPYGVLSRELDHSLRNEAYVSLQDFLDYGQSLVIFFSGAATRNVLQAQKLAHLQQQVHQNGGKLLVLTPSAPKHIKRHFSYSSSLSVFHDIDNEIAESFGLYNEQNPLWQWVSGIDEEEETLPAFYVIAPDKTVVYRFVDFHFSLYRNNHFSSLHFVEDLLDAVLQTSTVAQPPGLYQLVS